MELNGYGSHRLHQVEIEWTPEWEVAYQKLLELADKRRADVDTIERVLERTFFTLWVVLSLVAALSFWFDLNWLSGIAIVGIVVLFFYASSQYQNIREYESPTSSELDKLLAELHLLRSFTHDTDEMVACTQHEERMFNPSPEPDEDDLTSAIRDRLEEIGLAIESEPYDWLKPSEREVLSRLNFRRRYGRVRLKEYRKIEGSGDE